MIVTVVIAIILGVILGQFLGGALKAAAAVMLIAGGLYLFADGDWRARVKTGVNAAGEVFGVVIDHAPAAGEKVRELL